MPMPNEVGLQQALGGTKSAARATKTVAQQLREEEQRGRLMRGAQIEDACHFGLWISAKFTSVDEGKQVSEWIGFGQLKFTSKPNFSTGSQRVIQLGDTPIGPEGTEYDPAVHIVVPALAMVHVWKQDDRGFYVGAKVLLFALGAVPDGYEVGISAEWSGPAIRGG